ncbi:MAG: TSUP family transporter [Aeromicrobium sp.]
MSAALPFADLDPVVVAVVAVTLVVGAAVQGLVGLGLGLVAAPVTMLLEPALMPELLLWLAMLFPLVTLTREHHDIDWRGLAWSVSARIPGTAVGVFLLTIFSDRTLGVAVALMVLVSVATTAWSVVVPVNRPSLVTAGFASGITGTATSIGGPPLAILYQHRTPEQIRSTLGVYFVMGAALSLVGLAVGGELERSTFMLAMAFVPCLLIGFVITRVLRGLVPKERVRGAVLVVCAASAVVLLVRSVPWGG